MPQSASLDTKSNHKANTSINTDKSTNTAKSMNPNSSKLQQTRLIRLQQNQHELVVTPLPGQTLLQAARSQAQPIDFKCGQGTCGRCRVKVIEGSTLLAPSNQAEQNKLGRELAQGYRLACQTIIASASVE